MQSQQLTKEFYNKHIQKANKFISESISANNITLTQQLRIKAANEYEHLLKFTDITDYLLIDSNPILSKTNYIESYFNLGTIYKTYLETDFEMSKTISQEGFNLFKKSVHCFNNILRVKFEDDNAYKQIVSIYSQMCYYFRNDLERCVQLLQEAVLLCPESELVHYNMAFVYLQLNKLELSLIHYRISIKLCLSKNLKIDKDAKRLLLNNYNGICSLFRSIKQWPEALFYSLKAETLEPLDPNVQAQLGVIYTEMRRTDLAELAYNKAIVNYKKTVISSNPDDLLSELYLNLGHMHSYNGDNQKSIDCYNKSLQISPSFHLPFQNKLMNLSYLFDELEDKMYIFNQHKLVNKLYKKGRGMFKFDSGFYDTDKINIGIVSGDFAQHPVSYFIKPFLKNFNSDKFNVTCYSECIIDTALYNKDLNFKFIKNMNAKTAGKIIYDDKIHILFDLAGHTAYNRLDIFALKPSPIQISYIGYPYSTGLNEMNYRITDKVCDDEIISQKFYTEKLLFLENSFLCYNPSNDSKDNLKITPPKLEGQPFLKNKYLTIGCYNRLNKITDSVIKLYNEILLKHSDIRFVFKTKALLNKKVKEQFINKFNKTVHNRIIINDCTILHEKHLEEYNKIDVSFDTFPYSGTTTSCESLFMGVPVFTLYDSKTYFHAQNVTCSILKNSHKDLEFFILNDVSEIHEKLNKLKAKNQDYWLNLKENTRMQFSQGAVCNENEYIKNISNMLITLFDKHKNE